MGVLQAVIDDSGRGQGSPLVLGGCILPVDGWVAFTDQWKAILDEPPAIQYLKMKEAWGFNGQFRKFNIRERDAKVWRFVSVLLLHKPYGLRAIVDCDSYRKIFRGRVGKELDSPTFMASLEAVNMVVRCQILGDLPSDAPVKFVFDEQGKESDMFLYAWSEHMPRPKDARMNALVPTCPTIEDDKTFLPLQAADFLVWHYRQELLARKQGTSPKSPFWDALKILPLVESDLDEERLSKLMATLNRVADEDGCIFEYQLLDVEPKRMRKKMAQRKAIGRTRRGSR